MIVKAAGNLPKRGVARTQVQNILERKHDIMEAFEDNGSSSRKQQCLSTANTDITTITSFFNNSSIILRICTQVSQCDFIMFP